jgi:3'-phosphoadenosine 5'-phosphosulfate sulfotransferase (PAPS reductase)/FAD synthetase
MIDSAKFEEKVQKSIDILKSRSHISRLLIGLSGGKDSLVLCELVKMAEITNVQYFNMEFLPNLQIQYDLLEYACQRFNIPYEQIIKVPSEHFIACMRTCSYTWYSDKAMKDFPNLSRTKVFQSVARQYKGTVVTGVKKCDSLMMQRMVNGNKGICIYPLADWNLEEVLTFMKLRQIKIPDLLKKGVRGIGLDDSSIMYIYENYKEDFNKIEKVFPFVKSIILKYKYFDLHKSLRLV